METFSIFLRFVCVLKVYLSAFQSEIGEDSVNIERLSCPVVIQRL